ncbi:MAG: Clp protease ClpP, partial [Prosthecobacter sp.]|nr:Clp protease ClpP [Prosthecobacter sp.]
MPPAPFVIPYSAFGIPSRITASATAPKREPWFAIKAVATGAELRLRGYIGEASSYLNWEGERCETGGMGTLKEFEDALLALGEVPLITVYLTSEGGDFPTAVAISSILARQKARIVCVIDGYCYSAAPVIACAADEIRAAKNALLMIHDAEFWCAGADIATLEQHIATLKACNDSMAAAFVGKAGGTPEEWMARMVATTWMTGSQAHELKLVDTLLDEVALSAYQPLKRVTAAHQPPTEITALIDTPPVTSPTKPPVSTMKPTPELITAAAAFGITLTAESTEA